LNPFHDGFLMPEDDAPANWSSFEGGRSLGKFLQSVIKKNEIVNIKCIRM